MQQIRKRPAGGSVDHVVCQRPAAQHVHPRPTELMPPRGKSYARHWANLHKAQGAFETKNQFEERYNKKLTDSQRKEWQGLVSNGASQGISTQSWVTNFGHASSSSASEICWNENVQTCTICFDGDIETGCALKLSCSHGWYCKNCVKQHIQMRLDQGHVNITCPECGLELSEAIVRTIVPEDVHQRLLDRSLQQAVGSASDMFICPTADCPMRVVLDGSDQSEFMCPLCNAGSCLRCCVQPYHAGLTCQEHADRHLSY